MATRGNLYIVSAPSGGGKTSLTRQLIPRLARHGITSSISVSYTTRAPRPGEVHGEHYHFIDEAGFVEMIAAGAFLEQAHVFGRRYGTGRQRTEDLLAAGEDVILDIDWQGARQVRAAIPEAVSLFILPPSVAELERRLRDRSQDSEETIAARMDEAHQELAHYGEYDYLVVNEHFEQALEELAAICLQPRLRRAQQMQRHQALLSALLAK